MLALRGAVHLILTGNRVWELLMFDWMGLQNSLGSGPIDLPRGPSVKLVDKAEPHAACQLTLSSCRKPFGSAIPNSLCNADSVNW